MKIIWNYIFNSLVLEETCIMRRIDLIVNNVRRTPTAFLKLGIFRSSILLMINVLIQAITGYAFWLSAKRQVISSDVGISSSAIGVYVILANIASLGFGVALVFAYPKMKERFWSIANTAFIITFINSILVSVIFTLCIPFWSVGLREYFSFTGLLIALFTTLGVSLSSLQDSIYMAKRSFNMLIIRSLFNLIARLAVLPFLIQYISHQGIILSYAIGNWASILIYFFFSWRGEYNSRGWFDLMGIKGLIRYSWNSYLISVFGTSSSSILPVIVLNILGPDDAAYFYIITLISSLLFSVPGTMSTALFITNVNEPKRSISVGRLSLIISLIVSIMSGLFIIFMAPVILSTFDKRYLQFSRMVLIILLLSVIPMTFYNIGQSMYRAWGKTSPIVIMSIVVLLTVVIFSLIGSRSFGLAGVAMGWFVGQCAGASLWIFAQANRN